MYAVTGVSGQTGAATANALLAAGLPLRVIVRDENKAAPWAKRGAEVAIADISNPKALISALAGVTSVYLLNPPAYGAEDPFAVAAEMAEVFLEAIERSDIEKALVLSSISAHLSRGNGIIHTNHIIEKRMVAAAKPVTYLRPGYFHENWSQVVEPARLQGVLPSMLAPIDKPVPMVAVRDIGATAAKLMTETWFGRRLVELAGPSNTMPMMAAKFFGDALGKPVTAVPVPREAWEGIFTQSGMSERTVAAFIEMFDGFNNGTIRFAGKLPRRGPTTFAASAAAMIKTL
jgi:uncharacterized protein YbjT (DUF2867 family)